MIFFTLLLVVLPRVSYGSRGVLVGDDAFDHSRETYVRNNLSISRLTESGLYSCPTNRPYICKYRSDYNFVISCYDSPLSWMECGRVDQQYTFDEEYIDVFCAMKNKISDRHDHYNPFQTNRCLVIYEGKTKYFSVIKKVKVDKAFRVNTVNYERIFCADKKAFDKELEKLGIKDAVQPRVQEPVREPVHQTRREEKQDQSCFEEYKYYIISSVVSVILAIGGLCASGHCNKSEPIVNPFSDDDEQEIDSDTKDDKKEVKNGDQKDQPNAENDRMSFAQYLDRQHNEKNKTDATEVATNEAEHATEDEKEAAAPDMDIQKDVKITIEESKVELVNEALEFSSDLEMSTESVPEPTNQSEFTI